MKSRAWTPGRILLAVGCAPLFSQVFGSAFDIWYNSVHIEPLLTPAQYAAFLRAILLYNAAGYPVSLAVWILLLLRLRGPMRSLAAGETPSAGQLEAARRRAINLPWLVVAVAAPVWIACIPVFLAVLLSAPGELDRRVIVHLPASVMVSALIALTHLFLVVELLTQKLMYPVFFRDGASPGGVPGARPLFLRGRGLLWAVSTGVCPVVSLLLLNLAPHPDTPQNHVFAITVACLAVVVITSTAWMVGRIVVRPVAALKHGARRVAAGDLGVCIDMPRADEFGPLIESFNSMVAGLRERERIVETFGRHVGKSTADAILRSDPGLGGIEKEITIMFVDLRDFTRRSEQCSPQETVTMLNDFFTVMVTVVERHGGIVNKFLGDGFMALFGVTGETDHAARAIATGCGLLREVARINREWGERKCTPLAIGVGIHTGPAVVGSIGAPQRMEYTAIGDAVNLASRVEALTKEVGEPMLFTARTRADLGDGFPATPLPPRAVKGKAEPVEIYRLT